MIEKMSRKRIIILFFLLLVYIFGIANAFGELITDNSPNNEGITIEDLKDEAIEVFTIDGISISQYDGLEIERSAYLCTGWIFLDEGDKIEYYLYSSNQNIAVLALYSLDKTFIEAIACGGIDKYQKGVFTAKEKCYIRACYDRSHSRSRIKSYSEEVNTYLIDEDYYEYQSTKVLYSTIVIVILVLVGIWIPIRKKHKRILEYAIIVLLTFILTIGVEWTIHHIWTEVDKESYKQIDIDIKENEAIADEEFIVPG